jgi:hypothetical protein
MSPTINDRDHRSQNENIVEHAMTCEPASAIDEARAAAHEVEEAEKLQTQQHQRPKRLHAPNPNALIEETTPPNKPRMDRSSSAIAPAEKRIKLTSPKRNDNEEVPRFIMRDKSTGRSISELTYTLPPNTTPAKPDFFNRIFTQPKLPAYIPSEEWPVPPGRNYMLELTRAQVLWDYSDTLTTPLAIPPEPPSIDDLSNPSDEEIRDSRPQHNPWNTSNIRYAEEKVSVMVNARCNEVIWSASDVSFCNAEMICFPMMDNDGRAAGYIYTPPQSIATEAGNPFQAIHSDFAPHQHNDLRPNPVDAKTKRFPKFRWAFIKQLIAVRMTSDPGYFQIKTVTKPNGRYTPGLLELCAQQAAGNLPHALDTSALLTIHDLRDLQKDEQQGGSGITMPRIFQTILPTPTSFTETERKIGYHYKDLLLVKVFAPHGLSKEFDHTIYKIHKRMTAEHLLFLIARNTDVPKEKMTLAAAGHLLDDDIILEDAGVEHGAQLFVLLHE